MPVFVQLLPKTVRWAKGDTTAQAANSDAAIALQITVPQSRKYTVFQVLTDQNSASVDLLCKHVQGQQTTNVIDRDSNILSTDERGVLINELCLAGESFNATIRNRTGGSLTPVLIVGYYDEPA